MVWLNEISPWTVAAFGLGWIGVSGALALVLGKVLARTNRAAENEELALERARAERAAGTPAIQYEPTGDWLLDSASQDSFEEDEAYAGRAASGTRFKPVHDESDAGGAESEAARDNVRPLRNVR
ncbi:MAG: hypothetical protein QM778_26750 [Myxococcales bacterium]